MYGALHYRGDRRPLGTGLKVLRSDGGAERTVPVLLGADATGLPYEVLDVDYDAELDRSTVHLGPASPDTVRGNRSTAFHQREQRAEQSAAHARVVDYWRRAQLTPAELEAEDARREALLGSFACTEAGKGAA